MDAIRVGSKGHDVENWQNFLRGLNLYLGPVDGDFGTKTKDSTIQFQKQFVVPITGSPYDADGIVGNNTYSIAASKFGFKIIEDNEDDQHGPNWPPPPKDLHSLSLVEKESLFGKITYISNPLPGNPEHIKITNNWQHEYLTRVKIPQLIGIEGAPKDGVIFWNKKGTDQIIKLFFEWEKAGLMDRVLTWAGSWVPRFIRGSRTTLSNHCLPAKENVWTKDGPAYIADLKGFNDYVWTYNKGNAIYGKVTNFFNNGKKPILKINAVGYTLRCTPNHPILILKKQTLPKELWLQHKNSRGQIRSLYWTEMVPAAAVKPNDRMVCVKNLPYKNEQCSNIDLDWAEIIGLFIGDGCINHKKGKANFVSFCFPKQDRVRKYVKNLLTKYFGEPPKESDTTLFYYKERIYSKFLEFDKYAREKELPKDIWQWSGKAQARFLLGLLYSDGWVDFNKSSTGTGYSSRYCWKMSSKKLIFQLDMLLTSLGFRTTKIYYNSPKELVIMGKKATSHGSWTINAIDMYDILEPTADSMYIERIKNASVVDKMTSHCWGYEFVAPNFTHHKITKIEYDGDETVYDIEVDKFHNFITSGIVVSNSHAVAFDINAPWNGLGRTPALLGRKGCVRELVGIANNTGFFWGGHFSSKNRSDGMHFELVKL